MISIIENIRILIH